MHDVLEELHLVEHSALELSLQLINCSKAEFIWDDAVTLVLRRSEADILGSPVGSVEGIGEAIKLKTKQLQLMGHRVHHLHSHDALLLLQHVLLHP